jgi:hypothetical protein
MLPNYPKSCGYQTTQYIPSTEQVFALLRASMNKAALEYGRNRIV